MRGLNPRVILVPARREVRTRKRQSPENLFLLVRRLSSFGLLSSGRRPSGFTVERIVSIFGCTPKWMYERNPARRINATALIVTV
jgi:hypothetical protein